MKEVAIAAEVKAKSLNLFIRFVNYYSLTARSKFKLAEVLLLLTTYQMP